jgi:ER-bound oxygenase mpaB/B'/Rubber oxygenase, catalytic domain
MTLTTTLPIANLLPHQRPADFIGDALADDTMARILGPWANVTTDSSASEIIAANASHWQRIAQVNRVIKTWTDNASLDQWAGEPENVTDANIVAALKDYVAAARTLPPWADANKIARAEALFMDYGALSVTLLFCSSLPECYVVPDLASVLHATGQLEEHADYRVRSTGAMIFPVMMPGGLTTASGGGIAQVLKVRLIHATIRNLILRRSPQEALAALVSSNDEDAGVVRPHVALAQASKSMYHTLFAHGWNLRQKGLPCNQEELAYTLLTFNYVYLRSMRRLGLAFNHDDEEAFLHAWNVMGHVLGIKPELMTHTMSEAEKLFSDIQARGRLSPVAPDTRPRLGEALMNAMESVIPLGILKPIPVLMTQLLCGPAASYDIGVTERAGIFSRALFALFVGVTRAIDTVVRLFIPGFSLARMWTRMLGDRLMYKLLMDESRPLSLPAHLLARMRAMGNYWRGDGAVPLTTSGSGTH